MLLLLSQSRNIWAKTTSSQTDSELKYAKICADLSFEYQLEVSWTTVQGMVQESVVVWCVLLALECGLYSFIFNV